MSRARPPARRHTPGIITGKAPAGSAAAVDSEPTTGLMVITDIMDAMDLMGITELTAVTRPRRTRGSAPSITGT